MGPGRLTIDELERAVLDGSIHTVIVAITDMQGRLQGKRIHAPHFMDEVHHHGTEGCNYLLAVDVDMNTVDGYAMSSWESGYGDFVMQPDMGTLRRIPWHEGTAMVLVDFAAWSKIELPAESANLKRWYEAVSSRPSARA